MVVVIVFRLPHVLKLWLMVSYGRGYSLEAATCLSTVVEGMQGHAFCKKFLLQIFFLLLQLHFLLLIGQPQISDDCIFNFKSLFSLLS